MTGLASTGPENTAPQPGVPALDAHVHVWDLGARPQPWTAGLAVLQRSFALDDVAADLRALAARPNVAVKLSGLVTEADWDSWTPGQLRPVMEYVLDRFGPDRTMFGSDWPVCLLAASYAEVVAAAAPVLDGLTAAERAAVRSGTARTWYRLDEHRLDEHGLDEHRLDR